ncbi:MAG: pitrilysin family protein [Candidatus Omnitrophota bacterium]
MKRCVILLAVLLWLNPAQAHAQVRAFTLDNGMTVLVSEMPSSPMAAINLFVKTGSANEGRFMGSGITHFVEHMLFKGTDRRGPGIIPQEAKAMGGYINASTGYDHTSYILSVPHQNFSQALDLISDMVTNPAFDAVELEREREVIIKEMNMNNDSPDRKMGELVYQLAYHVHPYQYPIIGREDIFRALKREDLLAYHRALYVPNNMILSIAGGIRADDVLSLIQDKFKDFKARSFPLRNVPQEPEQIAMRRLEVDYPTDLKRLTLAYQSVPLLDRDLYALDVLAMALGQGASSRFYLELYKKHHLVESVSAGNYTPMDKGLFEISCLLKDQDVDKAIMAIKTMITLVVHEGLKPDELEKVKRQVMAENIYDRQTAEGMADKAAADVAYTGDIRFSDNYVKGISQVSNEDIKRVAAQYLIDQRLNIIVLSPKTSKTASVTEHPAAQPEIKKVVLSNGLTLLLKEDHTLPILTISAAFNGGMRSETLALNGLSSLTGSVWTKGLPGKTADQISREVERRAAGLNGSAGRNTFILSISGLKEDQSFLMDNLEKLLKKPTFPDVEINRDKEQLRVALVSRNDSVLQLSSRALVETLFEQHPFRWDSLGNNNSLKAITRADLLATFHHCITSDNGVISVFGDIDSEKIRQELTSRLGTLQRGKPVFILSEEPVPTATRIKELVLDKEQAVVMFGFRGPLIKDPDRYATEIMVNVLSSSLGGRLFKRIRDEFGKSYTVSGGVSPSIDAGMITFFALTTNEGVDKIRSIMQEEFARIRSMAISPEELSDAKNYLKSRMARATQSIGAQAVTRGVDELLGLGYRNMDVYPAAIDAVSLEEVKSAANKYLPIEQAALVITRTPVKKTGKL